MSIHFLPLTRDFAYNEEVARQVPHYGATDVHMSHTLCHKADQMLDDDQQAAHVRAVADANRQAGLNIWCWTHELNNLDRSWLNENGKLVWDDDQLKAHLERKYERFFQEVFPGLKGIVLTFAETDFCVYEDRKIVSDLSPEARIERLIAWMREICHTHNVELTVRDFVYRMEHVEQMKATINRMPDDVKVMSKCVPHDWHPFYPLNPMIGAVGNKEQWIEHDLGYEFEGQHIYPYCDLHTLMDRLEQGGRQGARTLCLRLDRYNGEKGQSAVCTPWGQLALQACTAWDQAGRVDAQSLIDAWEAEQFQGAWRVLETATEAVKTMMFPKKMWINNHSRLPSFVYARDHLVDGIADRLPVWTEDPDHWETDRLLREVPADFVDALIAESDEACRMAEKAKNLFQETGVDAPYWSEGLESLVVWATLWRAHRQCFFWIRHAQTHPGAVSESHLEAMYDHLTQTCRAHADRVEQQHMERGLASRPKINFQDGELPGVDNDAPFASVLGSFRMEINRLKEAGSLV